MQVRLLGPVEVVLQGRPQAVRGAGERAVLALLLLSAGRVVSAQTLIDALWGEHQPAHPANALQVRVSKLRRSLAALGADEVIVRAQVPGYVAEVDPERIDAHRFVRLVSQARSRASVDTQDAVGLYRDALGLWRGSALVEFTDQAWAQPEVARLEGLRDAATEELFDLQLSGSPDPQLVGEIEAALARRPLHERIHGQLMLALYRCGRQADALAAFQRARQLLRSELGLDPSVELRAIEQRILRQEVDVGRATSGTSWPTARLPMRLTSFVGRSAEMDGLRALLAEHRLVTLVGPGGVGKTSVAVELARGLQDDGGKVWLVRLAGVVNGEQVPRAVAAAVGIRDDPAAPAERRLLTYLRERDGLVVLDNCEHLIDACAALAEQLLGHCPRIRLLGTSREPLAASGEMQYAVPPLPTPGTGIPPRDVPSYPAAQLFLDRARMARPGLALDVAGTAGLAEICRRLDGIPLAIELAAAGITVLPVTELAARLRDAFPALGGGPRTAEARHRTLRATVDWSHRLLTDPEQVLFRRLSVFRGGFDLAAAEQVTAAAPLDRADVLGLLTRLVDRSLVIADHGLGARFHLLETLRHYAAEQLDASGEASRYAAAHAAHFTERARQGATGVRGPEQRRWLLWLARERDNLQIALEWLAEHSDQDPDQGLWLAASLGWFWYFDSRPDGGARVEAMLAVAPGGPPAARAAALLAAAVAGRPAACIVHPNAACASAARQSLTLMTALGDAHGAAIAGTLLAVEGIGGQDIPESLRLLDHADEQLRDCADPWSQALVQFVRMELHFAAADPVEATRYGRRALASYRQLDDHWGVSAVQLHLGVALHRTGQLLEAHQAYEGALAEGRKVGVANTVQYALAGMGHIALQEGDDQRAERWFTQAHAVAHTLGADGNALAALGQADAARRRGDLDRARRLYTWTQLLLAGQDKPDWSASALSGLGHVAELSGDLDTAQFSHRRAWQAARGPAAAGPAAAALEGLACLAAVRGQGETAAGLLGAAVYWRTTRHRPASPLEAHDIDRATRHARDLLGDTRFDACHQAAIRQPGDILALLITVDHQ